MTPCTCRRASQIHDFNHGDDMATRHRAWMSLPVALGGACTQGRRRGTRPHDCERFLAAEQLVERVAERLELWHKALAKADIRNCAGLGPSERRELTDLTHEFEGKSLVLFSHYVRSEAQATEVLDAFAEHYYASNHGQLLWVTEAAGQWQMEVISLADNAGLRRRYPVCLAPETRERLRAGS